jgi:hypothetical protein
MTVLCSNCEGEHAVCSACGIEVDLTGTFTASELKERLETATAVALALGRKEAATEVAEAIRRSLAAHYSPGHDEMVIPHETAIGLALEIASRPPGGGSEPLIAPTGHSDLPPAPEGREIDDEDRADLAEVLGYEMTWKLLGSQSPTPDLPEGSDQ